jgi:methylenetetrahydrofolate reductase (NADPH)
MKIKDILRKKRTISCEFFPPKTAEGIPAVFQAIDVLKMYHPDFISITYGAGGTTRGFTEEMTTQVKQQGGVEVMAHLTCVGQTIKEVNGVLKRLHDAGVENVIALRGDPPRGETRFVPMEGGFQHASELIEHIRQDFQFDIGAACYPEGHLESADLETDIRHTKLKIAKGASFLVTQLFYDNSHFFRFRDRAYKAGIDMPIVPGVLPILSTGQIRKFTALCGATIPRYLDRRLEKFVDDNASARELGVEYATEQVRELWENGVPGIHFYVLNRSYSVSKILSNLGLPGHTNGNFEEEIT